MGVLSTTRAGKKWLDQFPTVDKPIAQELLDSLVLVSFDQMTVDYAKELERLLSTWSSDVVGLFAVREVEYEDPPGTVPRREKSYWDPAGTPSRLPTEGDIGSEGEIAHLCRDLARINTPRVLDHPPFSVMIEKRCRHLVFIDDIVGSGTRVTGFVRWFCHHPKVRSWLSLGYVDIHVLAFAVTETGLQTLRQALPPERVHSIRHLVSGRPFWSLSQRAELERLCRIYGPGKSRLGYKNAFTFLVFSYGCSNTTPPIFWRSVPGQWTSLFGKRPVVDLGAEAFRAQKRGENYRHLLGKSRLLDFVLGKVFDRETTQLVALLGILAKHGKNQRAVAEILEFSQADLDLCLERLLQLNWIDANNHLTKTGRNLIASAKRKRPKRPTVVDGSVDFYYPRSLREPR